ncbi:hypothetical protein M758_11G039400 [Ceratodon purpureus]|uniref:Alpha N-terminal protein methyltransferase 1 n=1 Tax=Ceratodon purpureus TaxID=3225 RepID=A0A8T0GDU9_CERPU|nr:hypothetical protein KC19_11G040500 [Ceratodon purpureus]KAG0600506.1 hypothetical protein M758_11G039400 [Ceratodon purpureus]
MRACSLGGSFCALDLRLRTGRVGEAVAVRVNCSVSLEMDEGGLDTEGKMYASRKQMWEEEAGEDAAGNPKNALKKQEWYHKGVSYWEGVEASVDGVLGGYGNVNDRDVIDSTAFLAEIFKECPPSKSSSLVALDCGAGVGRVTKNFLLHHFHEVIGWPIGACDNIVCYIYAT